MRAHGQNAPLGETLDHPEAIFFIAAQPVDASRQNRPGYDVRASGPIIYAYVGGNPISSIDPTGLNPLAGAITGAEVGSAFGPVGTVVGGVVGFGVGAYLGWNVVGPMFAKPPADAMNPNGAKAPGMPGAAEGYCEPKGGPDWTRNPNGRGSGWRDASGNVWVPTGPGGEAHGGPHWDVQTPGGGYVNVYPGRARRP